MWTIEWSSHAQTEYLNTLNYWIERNGTNDYAVSIMIDVEKLESLLLEYPNIGAPLKLHNVSARRYVLSKNQSIIYQIRDEVIQILSFWDNRRDWDSLDQ